jgi:hypothetical protein
VIGSGSAKKWRHKFSLPPQVELEVTLKIIERQHSQVESHHGHTLTGSVRITTGVVFGDRISLTLTAMAVYGGNAELVRLGSAGRRIFKCGRAAEG